MGQKIDDEDRWVWFEGYEQAFGELRARASKAIALNEHIDECGRLKRMRLRDENGATVFEGTIEEALRAYPSMSVEGELISTVSIN